MNGSHAPVDWASTSELKGFRAVGGGWKRGEWRYGKLCGSFGACAGGGTRGEGRRVTRGRRAESVEEQRGSGECRDKLVGGRADSASGYTRKNDNRMRGVHACEWEAREGATPRGRQSRRR